MNDPGGARQPAATRDPLPSRVDLPWQKRALDIVASIALLVVFSPFLLLMAVWILVEQLLVPSSRGPILYGETRYSQGEPFEFYKIRIFKQSVLDALSANGGVIHTKDIEENLDRLTGYGRFLKRVYLDEIPQLYSVLVGDLTLVGPRPTNAERNAELTELRLNTKCQMKCGLTGPFQAGKGTRRPSDYEMDRDYIKFVDRHSGWRVVGNDLAIMWRTVGAVFRAAGE